MNKRSWCKDDEYIHIVESIEQGDFEMSDQKTIQRYPDGSTVLVNGFEWTVELMGRDADALLPSQTDRGEDYNLYRLSRHNTKSILRWQYEIDTENKREICPDCECPVLWSEISGWCCQCDPTS